MNENIDLREILKDCPIGTIFWSKLHGEVTFGGIEEDNICFPIRILYRSHSGYAYAGGLSKEGFYSMEFSGECLLVPSKEQQSWSKFKAPWLKKPKFDPKTLQPFDKVLARDKYCCWKCGLFSHFNDEASAYKCICAGSEYFYCIPYNEETKYLVGTSEEAPVYYRYWED